MWRKKDSQKKKKSVWSTVWKMLNRNVLFLVSWADSQGGHCVLLFIFLTLYTPAICWGKNDQDNLFLENQTKTRQPYSFYISVFPILYFCFSYNLAICWGEGGDGQPYCIIHFFFYYIFPSPTLQSLGKRTRTTFILFLFSFYVFVFYIHLQSHGKRTRTTLFILFCVSYSTHTLQFLGEKKDYNLLLFSFFFPVFWREKFNSLLCIS